MTTCINFYNNNKLDLYGRTEQFFIERIFRKKLSEFQESGKLQPRIRRVLTRSLKRLFQFNILIFKKVSSQYFMW